MAIGTAGVGSPAHAETKSRPDKVGEAPPAYDISKLTVSFAADRMTVRVAIADMDAEGTQSFLTEIYPAGPDKAPYAAWTERRSDGSIETTMERGTAEGSMVLRCGVTARWRIAKSYVRLRIPRACLSGVRAAAVSGYTGADGAVQDATGYVHVTAG